MTHPAIRDVFQSLARNAAFQEVIGQLMRDPHARLSLSGLTTTAKALYSVLLWQAVERPLMIVVDGNKQAEALSEAVETFFDLLVTSDLPRPQLIPALDVLPAKWGPDVPYAELAKGFAHAGRHVPFMNTIRRHHIAHHNQAIMMGTNMNLTYPFADWLFGTSDLDRGLLGHLFNGYDTHLRKRNLKTVRATAADSRLAAPAEG